MAISFVILVESVVLVSIVLVVECIAKISFSMRSFDIRRRVFLHISSSYLAYGGVENLQLERASRIVVGDILVGVVVWE